MHAAAITVLRQLVTSHDTFVPVRVRIHIGSFCLAQWDVPLLGGSCPELPFELMVESEGRHPGATLGGTSTTGHA